MMWNVDKWCTTSRFGKHAGSLRTRAFASELILAAGLSISIAVPMASIACGGISLPPIPIPSQSPDPMPTPPPCPECPVCPPPVVCPVPEPTPEPPGDLCEEVTCFLPGHVCVVKEGEGVCVPADQEMPDGPIPPIDNCNEFFTPVEQGWALLDVTPGCPSGPGVKCDCNGAGCTFTVFEGSRGGADSTPRYKGKVENWKTCVCARAGDTVPCDEWSAGSISSMCHGGKVERSEYPPAPKLTGKDKHPGAWGWNCGAKTVWSTNAPKTSLEIKPEDDGYGAVILFKKAGNYSVCASRLGRPDLETCKTAKVVKK
jgi:hypothetical protein